MEQQMFSVQMSEPNPNCSTDIRGTSTNLFSFSWAALRTFCAVCHVRVVNYFAETFTVMLIFETTWTRFHIFFHVSVEMCTKDPPSRNWCFSLSKSSKASGFICRGDCQVVRCDRVLWSLTKPLEILQNKDQNISWLPLPDDGLGWWGVIDRWSFHCVASREATCSVITLAFIAPFQVVICSLTPNLQQWLIDIEQVNLHECKFIAMDFLHGFVLLFQLQAPTRCVLHRFWPMTDDMNVLLTTHQLNTIYRYNWNRKFCL